MKGTNPGVKHPVRDLEESFGPKTPCRAARNATGDERNAAGDRRNAAGDGIDATGDDRNPAGDTGNAVRDGGNVAGDGGNAVGDDRDAAGDSRNAARDRSPAAFILSRRVKKPRLGFDWKLSQCARWRDRMHRRRKVGWDAGISELLSFTKDRDKSPSAIYTSLLSACRTSTP